MKSFALSPKMKRLMEIAKRNAERSGVEVLPWHVMRERDRMIDEQEQFERFDAQHRNHDMKTAIGRCGLQGKHLRCTFDNYIVTNNGQQNVKDFSEWYAMNLFSTPQPDKINFMFLGESRTGKNHLASAICNHLIAQRKSCLVITLTELNLKLKESYSRHSTHSEKQILDEICGYDFVVIDEVGVSMDNDSLKVSVNYIIDQRNINEKPTAILSNLSYEGVESEIGIRALNRIMERGHKFIFNWETYRQ